MADYCWLDLWEQISEQNASRVRKKNDLKISSIVWGFNVFKYCYGSLTEPLLRRIHISGGKRYGILISEEHFFIF